jgi:uncharacterized membrane protein
MLSADIEAKEISCSCYRHLISRISEVACSCADEASTTTDVVVIIMMMMMIIVIIIIINLIISYTSRSKRNMFTDSHFCTD